MGSVIEAAGGVLWRAADGGAPVEVALIHRPKYDDWSLPKGKLADGEHPVLAALREVHEETGFSATPGRPLGDREYLKDGTPKRVRYWAMRAAGGEFSPNDEVDRLLWLPAPEALDRLSPARDREVLVRFVADPAPTWPVILVRHGSAGERGSWPGDDRERPLDALGQRQADALVALLAAYDVRRVLSADVLRCTETVGPFARARRLPVEGEPLLSETGYAAEPAAAVARLVEIVAAGVPTVVCSQGRAIPGLLAGVQERLQRPAPTQPAPPKGGTWVLHVRNGERPCLVAIDPLEPPD